MKKWIGTLSFILLLVLYIFGNPWRVFAQAASGYSKINTIPVTGTTFTTGTLTDGVAYNFEVTGINSAGVESGPSNVVTGVIPSTGTHTVTLTWTPGANDVTFNVYDQQVAPANPPAALQVTVN